MSHTDLLDQAVTASCISPSLSLSSLSISPLHAPQCYHFCLASALPHHYFCSLCVLFLFSLYSQLLGHNSPSHSLFFCQFFLCSYTLFLLPLAPSLFSLQSLQSLQSRCSSLLWCDRLILTRLVFDGEKMMARVWENRGMGGDKLPQR